MTPKAPTVSPIVAMAVSIAGNLLLLPVIGSDDYLIEVVSGEFKIRIAVAGFHHAMPWLVAAFPVDDVLERNAVEVATQIGDENVHAVVCWSIGGG